MDLTSFNPNGIGLNNGNFIGLPFSENDSKIVMVSVPWDVTVSYSEGTAKAPATILEASLQLDLFQAEIPDAWKLGIFLRPTNKKWIAQNNKLRKKASKYIDFLENGGSIENTPAMKEILHEINTVCETLHHEIYETCKHLLQQNKLPAIVGGEHSVPLGLLKALHEKYSSFGVLHIDAHMDLRNSYEGFTYSHASIFNNAIAKNYVKGLVQVGIRDYCDEEVEFARKHAVNVFFDDELKALTYKGETWQHQCQTIISKLPEHVYVSFDIDGLNPHLCPNTGTPVPGGLEYTEALYLIKELVKSGRKIIGFDLCEVGGNNEWDANVGARLLYFLCNWTGRSQGWI